MMNNESNNGNSNGKKVPGYVAFVSALAEQLDRIGVPLVPVAEDGAKDGLRGPSGWVCFEVAGTGDKMYCNRTVNGPSTRVETTVPFAAIPGGLVAKDMRGLNGKIEAQLVADAERIASEIGPVLLDRLKNGERLRDAKAPVRAARAGS